MIEQLFGFVLLGVFALVAVALGIGAWMAPKSLPGVGLLRAGTTIWPLAVAWIIGTSVFARMGNPEGPITLGLLMILVGLGVFVAGLHQYRQARPEMPEDGIFPPQIPPAEESSGNPE